MLVPAIAGLLCPHKIDHSTDTDPADLKLLYSNSPSPLRADLFVKFEWWDPYTGDTDDDTPGYAFRYLLSPAPLELYIYF